MTRSNTETSHKYIVRLESRVHELEQQLKEAQSPKSCDVGERMTLPEVHRLLFVNCDDISFNKSIPVVNQIFYYFDEREKRLVAELEALKYNYEAQESMLADIRKHLSNNTLQLSCDGCKYDSERIYGCYICNDCIREHTRKERIDRYEPKDKQ